MKDYKPLHLIAGDSEDLKVMSACVQDAVAKVGDFVWLAEQRRFALVANRFVWEVIGDRRAGPFARVRTGLHFDDVLSVRQRNIRSDAKTAVLCLLAINKTDGTGENAPAIIELTFAGGGIIQLEVEAINAEMSDMTQPWQTRSKPDHNVDPSDGPPETHQS